MKLRCGCGDEGGGCENVWRGIEESYEEVGMGRGGGGEGAKSVTERCL